MLTTCKLKCPVCLLNFPPKLSLPPQFSPSQLMATPFVQVLGLKTLESSLIPLSFIPHIQSGRKSGSVFKIWIQTNHSSYLYCYHPCPNHYHFLPKVLKQLLKYSCLLLPCSSTAYSQHGSQNDPFDMLSQVMSLFHSKSSNTSSLHSK